MLYEVITISPPPRLPRVAQFQKYKFKSLCDTRSTALAHYVSVPEKKADLEATGYWSLGTVKFIVLPVYRIQAKPVPE